MAISDTKFDVRFPRMTLEDHLALARAPKLPAHQRWWNVPAKLVRAHQIAAEERERSFRQARQRGEGRPHNDELDAMRHARWSQRMASEIDPVTAAMAGTAHEVDNWLSGQPHEEELMDRRNNEEGRRAAIEGRPINPDRLQLRVGRTPTGSAASYPYRDRAGRYPAR